MNTPEDEYIDLSQYIELKLSECNEMISRFCPDDFNPQIFSLFEDIYYIERNIYITIHHSLIYNDHTIIRRVMPILTDILNNTYWTLITLIKEIYFKLDPVTYIQLISTTVNLIRSIADSISVIFSKDDDIHTHYTITINESNTVLFEIL